MFKLPEGFSPVSEEELRTRVIADARAGHLDTITNVMYGGKSSFPDSEIKLYAFALQRAAQGPNAAAAIQEAQQSAATSLWLKWSKTQPEPNEAMNQYLRTLDPKVMPSYPPGFTEPTDADYQAQARALDAVLAKAYPRKP